MEIEKAAKAERETRAGPTKEEEEEEGWRCRGLGGGGETPVK